MTLTNEEGMKMLSTEEGMKMLFDARKDLQALIENPYLKKVLMKYAYLPKAVYDPLQEQLDKVNAEIDEFFAPPKHIESGQQKKIFKQVLKEMNPLDSEVLKLDYPLDELKGWIAEYTEQEFKDD